MKYALFEHRHEKKTHTFFSQTVSISAEEKKKHFDKTKTHAFQIDLLPIKEFPKIDSGYLLMLFCKVITNILSIFRPTNFKEIFYLSILTILTEEKKRKDENR